MEDISSSLLTLTLKVVDLSAMALHRKPMNVIPLLETCRDRLCESRNPGSARLSGPRLSPEQR
jgi:hypothetical protein